MIWIVGAVFIAILIGSVARLAVFLRGRTDLLPESERSMGRKRVLPLALINILLASFGLFCLFTNILGPFEALIAVLVTGGVMEVLLRIGAANAGTQS